MPTAPPKARSSEFNGESAPDACQSWLLMASSEPLRCPFTGRLCWVTAMVNWPERVDSVTKRDELQRSAAPDPPFGTPRTMAVRLVADIQNRLFWRVGTGRASQCCVPSAGWSQASREGASRPVCYGPLSHQPGPSSRARRSSASSSGGAPRRSRPARTADLPLIRRSGLPVRRLRPKRGWMSSRVRGRGWLPPFLSARSAGAPMPGYQLGKSLSLVIPDLRMP